MSLNAVTMDQFTPQAAMVLLLLKHSNLDCEPDILARLVGISREDLEVALEELNVRVKRDDAGRIRLQNHAGEPASLLLPCCQEEVYQSSLARAVLHYYQKEYPAFYRLSLARFQEFIEADYVLSARMAYDIISSLLISLKVPLEEREFCQAFIAFGLQVQGLMKHFPWNARHALTLFYKMRSLAFFLGDRRSLANIDLGIGYLNINLPGPKKAIFYHQVMTRGVQAINNLGDSDIHLQTAGMVCAYYFIEGKYTKAINCAYSSLYLSDNIMRHHFDRILYTYAAFSAAYQGDSDVAVNILTLAMDRASRMERIPDLRNMKAILAHIYLLQREDEKALELIDEVLGTHHLAVFTYAELWATRSLAYYHYLRGNTLQSYNCFKNWLQKTYDLGVTHSNYIASPFVLELLTAYYLAGYAPPLRHTLQEELELYMASHSGMLRGAALCMAGTVRAREWGWTDPMTKHYLLSSLEVFRTLAAPLEMARTLIALARMHRARNEMEQAAATAAEVWGIHHQYGQPAWPQDLNDLIDRPQASLEIRESLSPAAFLTSLMHTVRQQYAWDSDKAFFDGLLFAVLASFGAARGYIFRLAQDSISVLSQVGMPESIPDTPEGKRLYSLLELVANRKKAVFRTLAPPSDKEKQDTLSSPPPFPEKQTGPLALGLAADAEEQGFYLIYLEGTLRRQIFPLLGEELFTLLDAYLATEINTHLRRSAFWRERFLSLSRPQPQLAEANPILFRTACMGELLKTVERVADKDTTVLILGESGVGKELIARRLHEQSGRKGEFVGVNLASTPDELFESEFYGHEKGSFTGANYQKRGLFELADKGTLFIDEVGDIPARLQVKLLRVLQEKQFMRVGGTRPLTSDFRLIAATNRNLEQEVMAGRFREDLYYRLSVVPLHVPPLRERPEDIMHLADYFLTYFSNRHQCLRRDFSPGEQEALLSYAWPGNVRELKNYVERRLFLPEIRLENMIQLVPEDSSLSQDQPAPGSTDPGDPPVEGEIRTLFRTLPTMEQMQTAYFEYAYRHLNGMVGGKTGVAKTLGMSRTTAYAWIEKLGLKNKFMRGLLEK